MIGISACQPNQAPRAAKNLELEVAIAHTFFAGDQLESPVHRPERQVATHCAPKGIGQGDAAQLQCGQRQAGPQQRQCDVVGQQGGVPVNHGQGYQGRTKAAPSQAGGGGAPLPATPQKQQAGGQLHQRIAQADARLAMAAATTEHQVAQHGYVFKPGQLVATTLAARAWHQQAERRLFWQGFALHVGTFGLPLGFEHDRQAVNDDVEKTADEQPQNTQKTGVQTLQARHQTTWPSLKMGRYMATTMPPMTVPRITMMMGSIRLEIPATMSSTSDS